MRTSRWPRLTLARPSPRPLPAAALPRDRTGRGQRLAAPGHARPPARVSRPQMPAAQDQPCKLSGSKLYLVDSFSNDPQFDHPAMCRGLSRLRAAGPASRGRRALRQTARRPGHRELSGLPLQPAAGSRHRRPIRNGKASSLGRSSTRRPATEYNCRGRRAKACRAKAGRNRRRQPGSSRTTPRPRLPPRHRRPNPPAEPVRPRLPLHLRRQQPQPIHLPRSLRRKATPRAAAAMAQIRPRPTEGLPSTRSLAPNAR